MSSGHLRLRQPAERCMLLRRLEAELSEFNDGPEPVHASHVDTHAQTSRWSISGWIFDDTIEKHAADHSIYISFTLWHAHARATCVASNCGSWNLFRSASWSTCL